MRLAMVAAVLGLQVTLIQSALAQGEEPVNASGSEASGATSEDKSWWSRVSGQVTDESDGQLDMSSPLARGGFIPMPIVITEPAVDDGLGLSAYFVSNPPPGSDLPPTRTILGGVRTGNGSEGVGLMRSGSVGDGSWLYNAALSKGVPVLDFYPGNRDAAIGYTNDIEYASLRARYRLGDSGYSVGPSVRWRRNDVRLDTAGEFPRIEDLARRKTQLVAIGIETHFDSRDNAMTPTTGANVIADWQAYSDTFGSDASFNSVSLFGAWFHSRDAWTLGAMGDASLVSSQAPFFMLPDINIRGLERNRYTSDKVVSSELELRRQITPRWGVIGFSGYGKSFGEDHADAFTWGSGVRYRIARQLGLDIGLDYAIGPDQEVFYIQFGHAWGFRMD